jgi:hypothetical protein
MGESREVREDSARLDADGIDAHAALNTAAEAVRRSRLRFRC